jgi:hypothetical protein
MRLISAADSSLSKLAALLAAHLAAPNDARYRFSRGRSISPPRHQREHNLGSCSQRPQSPERRRDRIDSLAVCPPYVLSFLTDEGAKVAPLPEAVTYAQASAAIRRLAVGVDAWPVPPAGLFVVEERTVYLRTMSSLTVVHELGHALDCAPRRRDVS